MRRELLALLLTALPVGQALAEESAARPNILWITCEDISPNLGCYGDPDAVTPTLDRLAARGVRYDRAFAAAPVCAPTRSTLIAGVFATSLGSQHMRSQAQLPEWFSPWTADLRHAGYYCSNNVKEDYNFKKPAGTWDESSRTAHWRKRKPGQPFFSVFNYTITHESQIRVPDAIWKKNTARLKPEQFHDPAKMHVPPYHPDTPVVRRDWARYHDNITALDYLVADRLAELAKDGLTDDTIVFFFGDHGAGLPRGKRFLYDSGLRVPLLIAVPKKWEKYAPGKPGTATDRLVSFIDIGPSILSLAGVAIPKHLQGLAFLGDKAVAPRTVIHAFRDRMDERTDCSRAVRDDRYKYIRNFMPWHPWADEISYMNEMPTMQEFRRLAAAGKLTADAAKFMAPTKPAEELYDTKADPWELHNLADSKEHRADLDRLRKTLTDGMRERLDLGLLCEAEMHRRAERAAPYAVARGNGGKDYLPFDALLKVADMEDTSALVESAKDADPAIAWWAVTKLATGRQEGDRAGRVLDLLTKASQSANGSVRVAAADGLARRGKTDAALTVLRAALRDENPWVRHAAAEALDAMGKQAAPALADVKAAGDDTNQYVVRVVRHLLTTLGEKVPPK